MVIRTTLEERGPITQEEIEMLEQAGKLPVVFDEDSPELTEEDLKGFRRVKEEKQTGAEQADRDAAAVTAGAEKSQVVRERIYFRFEPYSGGSLE